MSLEFLITAFIIVITPGSGVIYTLGAGLSRGPKAGIYASIGCTLGIVPHLAAVLFGLTAILHASAVVFNVIKYAGIIYLLYMAWQFLREKGTLSIEPGTQEKASGVKIIRDAILINILNPKLSIFFLAFLPQFIDPKDATPLLTMTLLSITFMVMTQLVFMVYGIFAGMTRDHIISRPAVMKWMKRSFAAAFGLLAARLAWAER